MRHGQTLFTYLLWQPRVMRPRHALARAHLIAYETVLPPTALKPLLAPMMRVAGRLFGLRWSGRIT